MLVIKNVIKHILCLCICWFCYHSFQVLFAYVNLISGLHLQTFASKTLTCLLHCSCSFLQCHYLYLSTAGSVTLPDSKQCFWLLWERNYRCFVLFFDYTCDNFGFSGSILMLFTQIQDDTIYLCTKFKESCLSLLAWHCAVLWNSSWKIKMFFLLAQQSLFLGGGWWGLLCQQEKNPYYFSFTISWRKDPVFYLDKYDMA